MDAPVTRYTGNHSVIRRATEATVKLPNSAAFIMIQDMLIAAGVPAAGWKQARDVAWAARKRLRRRRGLH
jgi:hypothetical protein